MNLFVVIPAYNESRHIKAIVHEARKYCKNIVVVDDGSSDATSIEASGAVVLKHLVNIGKGAALKTGCDYAISKGADTIVVMDADGQHNPDSIPEFLSKLKNCDIVIGYRELNKNMPAVFRLGNALIEFMTSLLYSVRVHDTQSGFRAFTGDAYRKIRWEAQDYSVESEMIALIAKHHLRLGQVRIDTIYNDKYKGTTVLDGIRVVINMFWWRLTR